MKRLSRMQGVTLLEIMLVLAIAAMVIVMSVRYYQSATESQQTNAVMQQILAITAAADNLAQGDGTYKQATTANITAIVGENNLKTPWGSSFTITPDATAGANYVVELTKLPAGVCTSLKTKLATMKGSRFNSTASTCTSANASTLKYTYSFSPSAT